MPAQAAIDVLTDARRAPSHQRHRRRRRHDVAPIWSCASIATQPRNSTTTICSPSARSAFAARRCPRSARSRGSTITTRHAGEPHAWSITVDAGVKSAVKPAALGQRHDRRGARSVLRHARAAEISEERPQRGGGRARCRAPPGHEPARRRLHARRRGARARDLERRPTARSRGSATCWDRTSAPMPSPSKPSAKACASNGFAGLPTLSRANSLGAIPVRQRPPGARQAAGRRGARRLCRLPAARPPSAARAVRHGRRARGRRQRASGEDRSALPRWRAGARADRARAERGAGARGSARGHDRRQRDHRRRSARRGAARAAL